MKSDGAGLAPHAEPGRVREAPAVDFVQVFDLVRLLRNEPAVQITPERVPADLHDRRVPFVAGGPRRVPVDPRARHLAPDLFESGGPSRYADRPVKGDVAVGHVLVEPGVAVGREREVDAE